MRNVWAVLLVGAVLTCGSVVQAAAVNVAEGKTVTGVSGTLYGAALGTVTDGKFLGETTQWQTGTVWWVGPAQIEIDLAGLYTIDGAIVQADNNDSYRLLYHQVSDDTWKTLWDVPTLYPSPWWVGGMTTRPGPTQSTWKDLAPVVTDKVRFHSVSGDNYYSVSEIQLRGTPVVPVPAAVWGGLALLGSLAGGKLARRRMA